VADYHIEFSTHAARQLRKLPREMQKRVAPRIAELASDPRPPGARLLAGDPERWRLRVGVYRIVYAIEDEVLVVLVVRIGPRRDIYRGL
jgi:mRNA interferase RelE/StbE